MKNAPDFDNKITVNAYLDETNGDRKYSLNPVLIEAKTIGQNTYQVTYEVGIPKEYFQNDGEINDSSIIFNPLPISVQASSTSHNDCDSSVSVCAYLTLNYTQISDHGWISSVSNKWTRYDGTVSMSNAQIKASCYASWYPGPGVCNTTNTRIIGVPTSGTTYSLTPGFAGSSNQVYINSIMGFAGYQQITLTRGLSNWNFGFCINQGGDEVITGCY